jgi:hypothetical protein
MQWTGSLKRPHPIVQAPYKRRIGGDPRRSLYLLMLPSCRSQGDKRSIELRPILRVGSANHFRLVDRISRFVVDPVPQLEFSF